MAQHRVRFVKRCVVLMGALLLVGQHAVGDIKAHYLYEPHNCGGDNDARGKDVSDPIDVSNGDYQLRQTDLVIPGRGFDFRFTRTYRSKTGIWSMFRGAAIANEHLQGQPANTIPASPMGTNWDHSYNISVVRDPGISPPTDSHVEFFDGEGRCYQFSYAFTDGDEVVFARPEFFAELRYDTVSESIRLEMADGMTYEFVDLDDTEVEIRGKIRTMTDRNGNQMQFSYDNDDSQYLNPTGRLVKVTDTLGREIKFSYDSTYPHLLKRIEDFTGREVEFDYSTVTITRDQTTTPPKTNFEKFNLTQVQLPVVEYKEDAQTQEVLFDLPVEHATTDGSTPLPRRTWSFTYDPEPTGNNFGVVDEDIWWAGGLRTVRDPRGNVATSPYDIVTNEYLDPYYQTGDNRNYRVAAQNYGNERYEYMVEADGSYPYFPFGTVGMKVWVSNRSQHIKMFEYYDEERRLQRRVDFDGPPPSGQGPSTNPVDLAGSITLPDGPVRDVDPTNVWTTMFTEQTTGLPAYNADWHILRRVQPNGEVITCDYDDEVGEGPLKPQYKKHGNLLSRTRTPGSGGGSTITETWTYLSGFGGCSCGTSFPETYTDGLGHTTTYEYDETTGNRTRAIYETVTYPATSETGAPAPGLSSETIEESWEYNSYGQVTVHKHRAAGSPLLSNGTSRQEDHFTYYDGTEMDKEYMKGYLKEKIFDATGMALTTMYEYDHVGNVVKITEPHGDPLSPGKKITLFIYNQLNELVRETTIYGDHDTLANGGHEYGYSTDYYYDVNGNVVRMDRQNRVRESGVQSAWEDASNAVLTTIREYDILDHMIAEYVEIGNASVAQYDRDSSNLNPSDFLLTRYAYDADENLRLVVKGEAAIGAQLDNTILREYDERDLLYRERVGYELDQNGDPVVDGNGDLLDDAQQMMVQFDYDGDRNLTRKAVNPLAQSPREFHYTYDGHDRLTVATDPDGDETEYAYDDADNRIAERHFDGSVGTGTKLSETLFTYDEINRLYVTQYWWPEELGASVEYGVAERQFHYPDSSLKRIEYVRHLDDMSNPWDPDSFAFNGVDYTYDSVGRLTHVTDGLHNDTAYVYDLASNVVEETESDWSGGLARIQEKFTTTYGYDERDRLASVTDSAGNVTSFEYDSRDNRIGMTDARGNDTAYFYDPADRLIATSIDMDGDGADPADADDIVTSQAWDDSSRLIGQQDDNGHWTSYAYDGADRRVATRMADGTVHQVGSGLSGGDWTVPPFQPDLSGFTSGFDAFGDATVQIDANGTTVASDYDIKGRLTDREITPFANNPHNVMGTTAEHYAYDALNRLILARDNDTAVLRAYDSLSRVISETYYIDPDGSVGATIANLESLNAGTEATINYFYNRAQQLYKVEYPRDAGDQQSTPSRTIRRNYDDLNRVTAIYDDGDDPSMGEFIATYDYIGRSRTEARAYGNDTTTTYEYDGRTSVSDGSGGFVAAPNDQADLGAGRVSRITHTFLDSGGSPPVEAVRDDRTFVWDANQNKASRIDMRDEALTDQRRYDYTYDSANRLRTSRFYDPAGSPPGYPQVSYSLDGVHNRTSVSDAATPDNAGPYYSVGDDVTVNQYTITPRNGQMYDPNGNLIKMQPLCDADINLDGSVDVFDFNTYEENFGHCNSGFTWQSGDLNGDGCVDVFDFNALSYYWGQVCYADEMAYDYRNQLVRYVDNVGGPDELTHEYRYDCFGRRLGMKLDTANSTSEQRFYYGGESLWQLCEVRTYPDAATDDEDFALAGTFVHGPQYIDEVVQYVPGAPDVNEPTAVYYHQDDLFNVMALTDENGGVLERFEYGDYGAPLNQDLSQLESTYPVVPFLFNGRFYDFEIHGNENEDEYGWYQYRTRELDPGMGRFATADSIGVWGDAINSGSTFAYCASNPQCFVDPMGTFLLIWDPLIVKPVVEPIIEPAIVRPAIVTPRPFIAPRPWLAPQPGPWVRPQPESPYPGETEWQFRERCKGNCQLGHDARVNIYCDGNLQGHVQSCINKLMRNECNEYEFARCLNQANRNYEDCLKREEGILNRCKKNCESMPFKPRPDRDSRGNIIWT